MEFIQMPGAAIISKFDLDSFRAQIKNVARPYLFYIQVPSPVGGQGDQRRFTYLAQSTKIPDRSVDVLSTNWQGYTYKLGGVSKWETWDVTFLVDDTATGYNNMRKWCDVVHNPSTNVHGDPGDGSNGYVRDTVLCQQIHHQNPAQVLIEFNLIGAWPSKVGGYELKYEASTTPATFTVTFEFIYAKFSD